MTTKQMSQPGSAMTGCAGKTHNTERLEINPSSRPCVGEILVECGHQFWSPYYKKWGGGRKWTGFKQEKQTK